MGEKRATMQVLIKDHQTVKACVEDLQKNNKQFAIDANEAFNIQCIQHQEELLPGFKEMDANLKSIMQQFEENQNIVADLFYEKMDRISELQSKIQNVESKATLFSEAMARQKKKFAEFKKIKRMIRAYEACITEIPQRRAYYSKFKMEATKYAENLAKLREEEIEKERQFDKEYGQYLPRDLVPGLRKRPALVEIRILGTVELPNIENVEEKQQQQQQ